MYRIVGALAIALFVAGPVAASDKTDVMATVHKWVDGFNKGDMKSSLATCADETSILDDFAPHEWHGSGACARWADAYDADAKKNGITFGSVTLGKPRHLDVAGDYAYLVVPAIYIFKEKGKTITESGSIVTVTLQKSNSGWRITAWSWADGVSTSKPAP
jgi:hypothetical protein